MKRLGMIALLLAAACPVSAAAATEPMKVMAHRGCWADGAPEVSVAGILACEALRPDFVEVDVRTTSDGHLVLMHDDTVDRTSNGTGAVAAMTLAQIHALRLRAGEGGPDAALTDERVPTLAEGLEAARGKFVLQLDIKDAAADQVAAVVEQLGMAGQATSWVFGPAQDEGLAHSPLRGTVGMIPVISECGENPSSSCRSAPMAPLSDYAAIEPAGFYMISGAALSDAGAQAYIANALSVARPAGSWIMVRTLFDVDTTPPAERQAVWRQLIDMGVHVVMTDHPGELLTLIRATAE